MLKKIGLLLLIPTFALAACAAALAFCGRMAVVPWLAGAAGACAVAAGVVGLFEIRAEAKAAELRDIELSLARHETEELRAKYRSAADQFSSAVSHGLRIPMSVIQGYADLLRGGLVTDEVTRTQYLVKICDKIRYMNDTLSHLLLDTRMERNAADMQMENVDVLALANQVASDVSVAAGRLGIAVRVQSADRYVTIYADAVQITEVLYNIIENAMKHMGREGAVNITVSHTDENVMIVVKDDGNGMDPAEAEHIFEKDFRGSNAVAAGRGHGLYLARQTIEAHGGSIFAKSGVGLGMAIYITLPAAQ